MQRYSFIAISFPFACLRLKSGSLWPAALLHASHNLFIYRIFERLTSDSEITPYIIGEFGISLALTGLIVAYFFWRKEWDVPLLTGPIQSPQAVQPEQLAGAL